MQVTRTFAPLPHPHTHNVQSRDLPGAEARLQRLQAQRLELSRRNQVLLASAAAHAALERSYAAAVVPLPADGAGGGEAPPGDADAAAVAARIVALNTAVADAEERRAETAATVATEVAHVAQARYPSFGVLFRRTVAPPMTSASPPPPAAGVTSVTYHQLSLPSGWAVASGAADWHEANLAMQAAARPSGHIPFGWHPGVLLPGYSEVLVPPPPPEAPAKPAPPAHKSPSIWEHLLDLCIGPRHLP